MVTCGLTRSTLTFAVSFKPSWSRLVLLGLTRLRLVSRGLTWFHWVSLGLAWSHLVSLGFTWTPKLPKGTRQESLPPKRKREGARRKFGARSDSTSRARARTHEPKPKSISRLDSPPNLRFAKNENEKKTIDQVLIKRRSNN